MERRADNLVMPRSETSRSMVCPKVLKVCGENGGTGTVVVLLAYQGCSQYFVLKSDVSH